MQWNWQHKQWPAFEYDSKQISVFESSFLTHSGFLQGTFKHFDQEQKSQIIVDWVTEEAYTSSKIEGELLDRESLQESVRCHFELSKSRRKIPAAEQGMVDVMVSLYENFSIQLTDAMLCTWQALILAGKSRRLHSLGQYRTHAEPMRIISGRAATPKIHYEAPPSHAVPQEMAQFVRWFNTSSSLPLLTRAAIAHHYFVCIHPFEDGNGRIARALAEKALSQGIGQPTIIGLSQEIEREKDKYYDEALALVNETLDITPWVLYFAETVIAAVAQTQNRLEFIIFQHKLFAKFDTSFNPRQRKVIRKMFRAGPSGFRGGMSAENYLAITKTSRATATRDLQQLVAWGVLTKRGERKHTRYDLITAAEFSVL
ncbi:MAG: Fic family protein [Zetaproteobacteria bacterium]|nr:Fic family protein [Zetaproteobacteria bacterium]